jgi:hypothetical protein
MSDFNERQYSVGSACETFGNVREVVEHCLSYFWERLKDGGSREWAEIEMLCDDIGTSDKELIEVFRILGYIDDQDDNEDTLGEYDFEENDRDEEE